MYEFKYRMHDPQIGRFWQIDPLADKYVHNSTYAFSENKVTTHVELEGLEAVRADSRIERDIQNVVSGKTTKEQLSDNLNVRGKADAIAIGVGLIAGTVIAAVPEAWVALAPEVAAVQGIELGVLGMTGAAAAGAETKLAAEAVTKEGSLIIQESKVITQEVKFTQAYKRPSNATTPTQRASVQGKQCVDCGKTEAKMIADHKTPLVKEYYQTGTIDKMKMRSTDAVQPQCPTCSAKQGAELKQYSIEQKKKNGL